MIKGPVSPGERGAGYSSLCTVPAHLLRLNLLPELPGFFGWHGAQLLFKDLTAFVILSQRRSALADLKINAITFRWRPRLSGQS